MREPEYLGNRELLAKPIIGFFSSRNAAPLSVMPTLDWARTVACDPETAVMSGFQSPMEREVLDILLSGRCGIIIVLNRAMYKKSPNRFAEVYATGRLLFISLLPENVVRPSSQQAYVRNCYIADKAAKIVFSSLHPGSSLYSLFSQYSGIKPELQL